MAKLFANLPQVLGPFLFGLQAGSMVGQLATRALGQYDLPVPRPASDELLVVPAAIDSFASDWSIQPDDARMWVCLREAAHHAVLGRPHVRARLDKLIGEYIAAFDPNPSFLEDRLGGVDPTDMGSLQDLLGDPETLLGEMESEAQRQVRASLRCVLCAVVGYVDHVMDSVGRRLIGSYGPITEALRRRRLEESSGTRILGKLFGVVLDESGYETGRSFVRGVTERYYAMAARTIELPDPGEGGPDVLMRHAVADLEASPADGERHVRMAHLRLTEEQFAELGARLQALADEYRELSDPSLPDASLVFALFHPARRAQAEGDAK